jgi:hypothetical protein
MIVFLSLLLAPHKERPLAILAVLGGEAVDFVPTLLVVGMVRITAFQSVAQVL